MHRVLILACVVFAVGCSGSDGGGSSGPSSLVATIGSQPVTFTDVLASWPGGPFNRVRVDARRMVGGKLEQIELKVASDNAFDVGRTYACGENAQTGMVYRLADEAYIDDTDGGACTITITQFTAGQDIAGTFSGTLLNDKTAAMVKVMGTFRSKVAISN